MPRPPAGQKGRIAQVRAAFDVTRRNDPRMLPIVVGTFLGVLAVFVVAGLLTGQVVLLPVLGFAMALLAATSLFGRRAQRSAFAQVEGQPGAAVAVIQSMRGDWRVTPVVAVNRHQDLVHRVIGRPGVILVAEGQPGRVTQLISNERRRVARVAAETPIYDVVIGDGEGQVPLRRLQGHLTKLPRNLKPPQVREVEGRMRALGQAQPPIPKGPIPRNARAPRGRPR